MTMKYWILRILTLLLLCPALLRAQDDITQLPIDQGLPLMVRTGVKFVSVTDLNETDNTFSGVVDMRLIWTDLRQRYDTREAADGFKEWRTNSAVKRMETMYVPQVAIANFAKEPSNVTHGLRIYPNGRIELMQRYTGIFKLSLDVMKFPFDSQPLAVELISRRAPLDRLFLTYDQDDLNFSDLIKSELESWTPNVVTLRRDTMPGWYGQSHARVWASLEVTRKPLSTLAIVFIPMLAVILIPLIGLWLQKQENGEFKLDAMDIANVLIGGLFAVIALNFAVVTSYSSLGSGDNPVNRLFGICYVLLGVTFAISLLLFRFDLPHRWFGRYVSEEVFHFCSWGIPAITLTLSASVLFMAAA